MSSFSILKSYKILTFLFDHPDGIVFPKNQLEQQLSQLVRQNNLSDPSSSHNDQEIIIAALQTIKAGKITEQFETVKAYLTHHNPSIRFQALDTLTALNTPLAKRQLEKSLLKEPISFISKVIVNTENSAPIFSDKFLQQLAKHSVNKVQQFESLINILTHLSEQSASKLFNNILNNKLMPKQRLTLFNLCSSGNISPPMSEQAISYENITQQSSAELRYAYASCYFSDHSKTITSDNIIQLKKRTTLNHFMTDPIWSENHKNALLLKAAESDSVIAKTMLLNKIKTLPSSQQDKALRILAKHGLTSNLEPMLWTLLKNQQGTNELRLQA
ncbi:MAG: HEAT repeat domain-containing protein, partial [Thiotrichaceae bacterium]|nr:HEAT repeat domain-containing protein [Thiotrichaceae bacterium]